MATKPRKAKDNPKLQEFYGELARRVDETLALLDEIKRAAPGRSLDDWRRDYGRLAASHVLHSNWTYQNDKPDCGWMQVERHLADMRTSMWDLGRYGDDEFTAVAVAFAVRDAFGIMEGDAITEESWRATFERFGVERLWYPLWLAKDWSNDLVAWADKTIGTGYDEAIEAACAARSVGAGESGRKVD